MSVAPQTTLNGPVRFEGIGLHSGTAVAMTVHPAAADSGIVFERIDLDTPPEVRTIRAGAGCWVESALCTTLVNAHGTRIATIEHLMAAFAGTGIDNAHVTIGGPELPIMDGSARDFVAGFQAAGQRLLDMPLTAIRVLAPVEERQGDAMARLEPAQGFELHFAIDFAEPAIGRQERALSLSGQAFAQELAGARTFTRLSEVQAMRAAGLALGGSLDNAVVFDGANVLTPGGLRWPDEPVRHKMLDALGDLAVAGAPILGRYSGHKAGHALTGRLVRALLADPASHERVILSPEQAALLPGRGTAPAPLRG